MRTVDIGEARTHLSRLVERAVAAGEPFIIAKAGRPLVRVVPIDAPPPAGERRLGFLRGQVQVPDDFDRMGHDVVRRDFEGG
ncbi:type II toxin-antitoxin system prevent-host-death family antitoxin [Myxococcota bacterium]|nr:type II toxin-antitoxin system prevent-host-death family antitoxin [Myxococcota bacterium]